jgi:hypothetical protein
MTEDILAPYRKKPLAPPGAFATPGGKADYAAFVTKDHVPCLRIRRKNFLTYAVGYNILLINTYDDDKGKIILLHFSVMKVKIEGRNLQALIHALNSKKVDSVLEFDPDRWAMPTDVNAPFIESIEVVVDHGDGALGESKP